MDVLSTGRTLVTLIASCLISLTGFNLEASVSRASSQSKSSRGENISRGQDKSHYSTKGRRHHKKRHHHHQQQHTAVGQTSQPSTAAAPITTLPAAPEQVNTEPAIISSPVHFDDFISGGQGEAHRTNIGALGWRSTIPVSYIANDSNHKGICRLPTTNGGYATLRLNMSSAFHGEHIKARSILGIDMTYMFRVNGSKSYKSDLLFAGLQGTSTANLALCSSLSTGKTMYMALFGTKGGYRYFNPALHFDFNTWYQVHIYSIPGTDTQTLNIDVTKEGDTKTYSIKEQFPSNSALPYDIYPSFDALSPTFTLYRTTGDSDVSLDIDFVSFQYFSKKK